MVMVEPAPLEMDREARREEFKLWADRSAPEPGAPASGNMVMALSFSLPLCKESKWADTGAPGHW